MKLHNPNWLQIPDHPYIILITGCSGTGKTNLLFSLIISNQVLIKFVYTLEIHMKQNINFSLRNWKNTGLKHFYDSIAFIEYSNDMDDIKTLKNNATQRILFCCTNKY